ncbi:MAG TPA: hypothetical protein VGO55_17440 [Allosphingosinicella sp.]|jgi:hypothetical protein|nr:hypothetical protein [Allosphingosinicella sp.]
MRAFLFAAAAAALAAAAAGPADSQSQPSSPGLSYADLADLGAGAPVVAHVRVRDADALRPEEAPNVAAGYRRFQIEAEVVALIRGTGGIDGRVRYLVDLPNDSRGRPARIGRRAEMLVMANRVPNRPGDLRLIAADAQIPYSPEAAETLRAIVRESSGPDAAPRIVGIGRAFHVPGSLAGESETQFFLLTADNRPISLTVLRRPGEQPRWSVALSEIVDDSAAPPAPNTLLWYRLACTLPARLPADALSEASAEEAQAIQTDYRLVMDGLGRCARTRVRR